MLELSDAMKSGKKNKNTGGLDNFDGTIYQIPLFAVCMMIRPMT